MPEDLHQLIALGTLRERIELAKVRCMSVNQLLDKAEGAPILDYWGKSGYLFRLTEINLDDESAARIAALIDRILEASRNASQLEKRHAESLLRRLIRSLPIHVARPIALTLITERRKSRRLIGARHLQRIRRQAQIMHRDRPQFSSDEASAIMQQLDRTKDTELLELMIFHPETITSLDVADKLLSLAEDGYLRMRVFEALLMNEVPRVMEAGARDTEHFIRAAARLGRRDLLPGIRQLLDLVPQDYRAMGEVISALGRLGAQTEVEAMEAVVEPALSEFERRFRN